MHNRPHSAWLTPFPARYMSRFGEAIFERRDVLGISGPDAAALSESLALAEPAVYAKFSQQTLSRWESDRTGAIIAASSPARIRSLARVLQWTVSDFEEQVGVPAGTPQVALASDNEVRLAGGLVMVPVFGVANGGKPDSYGIPVDPKLVRGNNTRAYQVEGNSMSTGREGSIDHGDWVLVDTSLTKPINGKIFLLEIIGDGATVKRVRQVGGAWLFLSDNLEAGEAWREDQVRLVGQVYGKVEYSEVH